MPASSLTRQLASETTANAQQEASPKQQQPPNDGSVDLVLAPAATGAIGRAQNPQDPVPSHPGEIEQGDPEEGLSGDPAEGIQEGSTPSNPAQDEKQDPAGDSPDGSGDDTGGTNSNQQDVNQAPKLAPTTNAKDPQNGGGINGDNDNIPSITILVRNDKASGADDAGELLLYEATGGGIILGTLTLSPGAQTTRSGHVISVGSGVVVVVEDGVPYTLRNSGVGVIARISTLAPEAQTTLPGHMVPVRSVLVVVDGMRYTWDTTNGGAILGTLTLPLGAQTTCSGHTVSIGTHIFVVDGISHTLDTGVASTL